MNVEQKIKQRFKDYIYSSAKLNVMIKNCNDQQINQYLKQRLEKQPLWQKISYLIIGIVKDIKLPICKNCGKVMNYSKIKSNPIYCSYECKKTSPEYKLKCSVNHIVTQETQQKRKKTCLQKYGVENVSQLQEIKDKKCQTELKNHGVKYSFQSKDLLEKSKQTNLKKYGVEHISQVQYIKNQKHIKRCKLEYKRLQKYKKYVIPKSTLQDLIDGKQKIWTCMKCGKDFIQNEYYTTGHIKELPQCPRCWNCYPQIFGESRKELELLEYIKSIYKGEIEQHNRTIIKPKELDIVLPELKLAIQFNGDYWHSEAVLKIDDLYHLNKTELCQKAGYRLIHIFEYEWETNNQIIKQKLKSIICKDIPSIYGRKCQIKQIESKQKNEFLNAYHIQGQDKSNVKLGLYFNQQLVGVMTFCKSRFNENYEYQLSRFATSKRVIGGASKLLKYFQKHYNPKSIITYADRRYSIGNLYYKLGFKLDHISEPSFVWSSQNHDIILSRFDVWKINIKRHFPDYNGQKIEDFMSSKKFNKLRDCGNYVFVKKY